VTADSTDWALEGDIVIACNCDYGCPCNFNGAPSTGNCDGQWTWHVEEGHVGDVRLDGLTFTVACDWPGAIHEGGGHAVCLYDERADADQTAAIRALVEGALGGPWAIFINTYELDPPRPVAYSVHVDGLATTVTAGAAMRLDLTPITNPVSGAEAHPSAVLPEGLVCKEMAFAKSAAFTLDDNISWDHTGRYAAVARFSYGS
jgi:hypothetical protein